VVIADPSGGFVFRFDILWYPEHEGAYVELADHLALAIPETPEDLANLVAICCKRALKNAASIDCSIRDVAPAITPYTQEDWIASFKTGGI
jgi:hypothetical protein